eukprot:CAMPEP_0201553498 /NCGR_PEP_ID=MMETSP0173_2-20130828/29851_1 /ASSEMBLY_ACC=CAM_ASM_000268 /TAXON_ID=218659 /ORGANISM="Vexillifera sp., Strain DIVA3 564/2" /LENGTH=51 /DNA_ID=CAMNT_0047964325 /DNA_START=15 /DNA_END=166 /DNA_ORIENTATION=-
MQRAQQQEAIHQFKLGVRYEHGRGIEKDMKEAARLYQLAAKQGFAMAQYNL